MGTQHRSTTVLVVDDNRDICDIVRFFGGSVAPEARFAVRSDDFEELASPGAWTGVDAAIIDETLPSVRGHDLALAAHRADPSIRIVMMSAAADYLWCGGACPARALAFDMLQKPFDIPRLQRSLQHLAGADGDAAGPSVVDGAASRLSRSRQGERSPLTP